MDIQLFLPLKNVLCETDRNGIDNYTQIQQTVTDWYETIKSWRGTHILKIYLRRHAGYFGILLSI